MLRICSVCIALIAPRTQARGILPFPYVPTATTVTTTLPIIEIINFFRPVTFTASVAPTVGSVLLGPSDGVVLFSVAGSTALSYVQKSILGSAMVARSNSVAGTAQLTVERSSKGLLLLPGLYNITAEYSGSSDGHYQPSSGYAPFKIGITTPPVQWRVAS
ncbi:hypothetical protein CVIRNUC_007006 [Coccomyxa viridis]|uniref:Uncharacterized protein n=1 Tax=Coccomyxa viridis TaxID=1274662 RepID=A0AAV1IAA7_9CHLO|nr:hypothetical protein CVIRNUC_007006 [Coccomyxa viridis]